MGYFPKQRSSLIHLLEQVKETTFEELNADTALEFEWISHLKKDYENWHGRDEN